MSSTTVVRRVSLEKLRQVTMLVFRLNARKLFTPDGQLIQDRAVLQQQLREAGANTSELLKQLRVFRSTTAEWEKHTQKGLGRRKNRACKIALDCRANKCSVEEVRSKFLQSHRTHALHLVTPTGKARSRVSDICAAAASYPMLAGTFRRVSLVRTPQGVEGVVRTGILLAKPGKTHTI